jgi:hypothetical protein
VLVPYIIVLVPVGTWSILLSEFFICYFLPHILMITHGKYI